MKFTATVVALLAFCCGPCFAAEQAVKNPSKQ